MTLNSNEMKIGELPVVLNNPHITGDVLQTCLRAHRHRVCNIRFVSSVHIGQGYPDQHGKPKVVLLSPCIYLHDLRDRSIHGMAFSAPLHEKHSLPQLSNLGLPIDYCESLLDHMTLLGGATARASLIRIKS